MTNSRRGMKRRSFLGGAAATAGVAALPLSFPGLSAWAAERSIVWGTNEAYARPTFLEPFTSASGIDVKIEYFADPAEVVTKVQAGGAGVDILLDGSYHVEISYAAGVLSPLDIGNIPNWDHVVAAFKGADGLFFDGKQYGVPFAWGTDSIAYRADLTGGEVNDMSALFESDFAGRIGMPAGLFESLIVAAMYLGFEKPFDMSKEELDEATNLLIKQKPMVRTYWDQLGDLTQQLATGEVVVSWAWEPVLELRRDDIDVRWGFPKQGQLAWYDACYLTTEAVGQRKADSEAFINYLIGDTYGVLLGQEVGYRTAAGPAIEAMEPALRDELAVEDPMGYLKDASWFLTPADPQAYQDAWDRVLNA
jgi:spermidine/putrescine transport system substrate-binding protein